jgi:hypothetical protein
VQVAIVIQDSLVNKNHLLYNNAPSVTLAFASMNILGFQDKQNSWCNFVGSLHKECSISTMQYNPQGKRYNFYSGQPRIFLTSVLRRRSFFVVSCGHDSYLQALKSLSKEMLGAMG